MFNLDRDKMAYIQVFTHTFIHSGNTDINLIKSLYSSAADLWCGVWCGIFHDDKRSHSFKTPDKEAVTLWGMVAVSFTEMLHICLVSKEI